MDTGLLAILSIVGIFALYWAIWGQWKYNKMLREAEDSAIKKIDEEKGHHGNDADDEENYISLNKVDDKK